MRNKLQVRLIGRYDLKPIVAIDREVYGADAWTVESLAEEMRQSLGYVAILNKRIVGYIVFTVADNEIDVVTICVAPDYRRQYVGTQLVQKMMEKLNKTRDVAALMAREDSLESHLFLRSLGFRAVQIRRGWYGEVDGYEFVYDSQPSFTPTNRVSAHLSS